MVILERASPAPPWWPLRSPPNARTAVALQPPAPDADPLRVGRGHGLGDAQHGGLELGRHEVRDVVHARGGPREGVFLGVVLGDGDAMDDQPMMDSCE